MARFHELVGRFPDHITMITLPFKAERFEEHHREALRWPRAAFQFVGVDPERSVNITEAAEGETKNSLIPFMQDPYGCAQWGGELTEKRATRDPFKRGIPYMSSCKILKPFLKYCSTRPRTSSQARCRGRAQRASTTPRPVTGWSMCWRACWRRCQRTRLLRQLPRR